ncbi:MAG TPA: PH domain-containing protein [Sporichthyaceae bacterium]|jgi:uncharacterized membrane protein YdbT with pleckstrin-like domain|nr:PH domain-containing protein [Sporichthyaceae bacterium]
MTRQAVAADGEQFLLQFRRHSYVLLLPVLVLGVCSGVGAFLVGTVPDSGARGALRWIISAGILVVVLRWSVWPFAVWYGNRHVITTGRVVRREGVLARHGAELAVHRIVGIALSRSVLQRAVRAGRLSLTYVDPATPGGGGVLVIDDVPLVAEVQQILLALTAAAGRTGLEPPAWPADPALPDLG